MTDVVYVLVVPPSCAVTTVVMVFVPTDRPMAPDAEPDAKLTPFTVTVELELETVGVTVIAAVVFGTEAV